MTKTALQARCTTRRQATKVGLTRRLEQYRLIATNARLHVESSGSAWLLSWSSISILSNASSELRPRLVCAQRMLAYVTQTVKQLVLPYTIFEVDDKDGPANQMYHAKSSSNDGSTLSENLGLCDAV
eukprot:674125-Amphidinium_carterae.4